MTMRLCAMTGVMMAALTSAASNSAQRQLAEPSFVTRGYNFEIGVLSRDVRAFRNRKYVFDVVPDALLGWQFTRLGGGLNSRLRITAKIDTTVHGATSIKRNDIDMTSWTQHPDWALRYTDGGHTTMPVFSRDLKAGEEVDLPDGSWTGLVLLAPKLEVELLDLHPEYKTVPGTVIDYVRSGNKTYIGSPSIAILPDGSYLASHDLFGGGSGADECGITRVFRSPDRGITWERLDDIRGLFWATLFVHRGDVYAMGTYSRYGSAVIRKSVDRGRTWTEPNDPKTGLLLTGAKYHCAPVPVLIHNGRVWRAMEDAGGGGGWGSHFRAFMMSAPVDADLLDADSWTSSNRIPRDPAWRDGRFKGWLEGNAVATPEGEIVNILRAEDPEFGWLAAIICVSSDGKTATFDPETGFVALPGGNHNKFTVRFDPESTLYWALTNYPPTSRDVRNALALASSPDLTTWEVRSVILFHPDPGHHGFQYPDWQFDGDDVIVASRTAYDDGHGGAHNFHDANYLTFHRVRSFRQVRMADSHPLFKLYHGMGGVPVERQVTTAAHGHILTNTNVWSPDSQWLVYDCRTVEDVFDSQRIERVNIATGEVHVLVQLGDGDGHDLNQRNIAVSVPDQAVRVNRDHPRNHDGSTFTALVTRTIDAPKPGSDDISKAFGDAWIGTNGYLRPDGTRQERAIAFLGHVRTTEDATIAEVFIVDLPSDLTVPGDSRLEGAATQRPAPPRGVSQRRLTSTANRTRPGVRGPRHWPRSSADGARIAFLMEDDAGVPQFWTVSPNGGTPIQATRNPWPVQSAFSWSPDGCSLAYIMDNSVFVTRVETGESIRLTERSSSRQAPTPHSCCFSPDGTWIAFSRPVRNDDQTFSQIFVVAVPEF